jgi:hypothetical protein
MDAEDAKPLESRPPTKDDLLLICRSLNEQGARYVVVGGFAMIEHGFTRATEDIDLLIEDSPANLERVRQALQVLPDRAVREVTDKDLREYIVVRVADEVVVDLMLRAGGVSFGEAENEIEVRMIEGVGIRFASARLLWRTKQTHREKDELDRQFLELRLGRNQPG